jgi:hypothetical protein
MPIKALQALIKALRSLIIEAFRTLLKLSKRLIEAIKALSRPFSFLLLLQPC